jgi:hypothetical protein
MGPVSEPPPRESNTAQRIWVFQAQCHAHTRSTDAAVVLYFFQRAANRKMFQKKVLDLK